MKRKWVVEGRARRFAEGRGAVIGKQLPASGAGMPLEPSASTHCPSLPRDDIDPDARCHSGHPAPRRFPLPAALPSTVRVELRRLWGGHCWEQAWARRRSSVRDPKIVGQTLL